MSPTPSSTRWRARETLKNSNATFFSVNSDSASCAGCTAFAARDADGGTDYLPSHGIDKLQWSVVHDITGKTGRIWPHRRPEDGWDSGP